MSTDTPVLVGALDETADAEPTTVPAELTGGWLVGAWCLVAGALLLAVGGFVNSFSAVERALRPSFGELAWTIPVLIDCGIAVFSGIDLLFTRLDMRIWWLRLIPWSLNVATIWLNVAHETDSVGVALRAAGQPLPEATLAAQVADDPSATSIFTRIRSGPLADQFLRTIDQRVSLAEWDDIEPYQSLCDTMRASLIAAGGKLSLDALQQALSGTAFSPKSVEMYAHLHPDFVFNDGSVRLRDPEEEIAARPPDQQAGCFRLTHGPHAGCWAYVGPVRHRKGGVTLFRVPRWVARVLGIDHGATPIDIRVGTKALKASWPNIDPSLHASTLRPLLDRVGAADGDLVVVVPCGAGRGRNRCPSQPATVGDAGREAGTRRRFRAANDTSRTRATPRPRHRTRTLGKLG